MKKVLAFVILIAIVAGGWLVFTRQQDDTSQTSTQNKVTKNAQTSDFKKSHSLTDPTSIWVIANKQHPLQPTSYAPADLTTPDVPLRLAKGHEEMQMRQEAATALEKMFAAAKTDGLNLMLSSAYRSFSYQTNLYNYYVNVQGKAVADSQSARPGYSEHQTGLAADIGPAAGNCVVEQCFATTPEGKWVAANAYKYGFIIRYQQGRQATTGYIYEPWHVRYVGTELSQKLHSSGNPVLEDYFGLGNAADY